MEDEELYGLVQLMLHIFASQLSFRTCLCRSSAKAGLIRNLCKLRNAIPTDPESSSG